MNPNKTSRIQLRMRENLKREILAYARRNHTSTSQLVTDYFTSLLAEEREAKRKATRLVDAEQI